MHFLWKWSSREKNGGSRFNRNQYGSRMKSSRYRFPFEKRRIPKIISQNNVGNGMTRKESRGEFDKLVAGRLGKVARSAAQNQYTNKDMTINSTLLPEEEWPVALSLLEKVSLFAQANSEEKLELTKRVRSLQVMNEDYILLEGQKSLNPAIFIILQGEAVVSMMVQHPNHGSSEPMQVDIAHLRTPNYFGEGTVLTGDPAYASVRAEEELHLYVVPKADIDLVIGEDTRNRMIRDHRIRQFKKQHLHDLWDVIRNEREEFGRDLLRHFCYIQNKHVMNFYDEVQKYKHLHSCRDFNMIRAHAKYIWEEYLDPGTTNKDNRIECYIHASQQQKRSVEKFIELERISNCSHMRSDCSSQDLHGKLSYQMTSSREIRKLTHSNSELTPVFKKLNNSLPNFESLKKSTMVNELRYDRAKNNNIDFDLHSLKLTSGNRSKSDSVIGVAQWESSYEIFDGIILQSVNTTMSQGIMPDFIHSHFFEKYLLLKFPLSKSHAKNDDDDDDEDSIKKYQASKNCGNELPAKENSNVDSRHSSFAAVRRRLSAMSVPRISMKEKNCNKNTLFTSRKASEEEISRTDDPNYPSTKYSEFSLRNFDRQRFESFEEDDNRKQISLKRQKKLVSCSIM